MMSLAAVSDFNYFSFRFLTNVIVVSFSLATGFYKRQKRTREWDANETIKFYRCLHSVGTDFSLMLMLFPNRSRRDLKLKVEFKLIEALKMIRLRVVSFYSSKRKRKRIWIWSTKRCFIPRNLTLTSWRWIWSEKKGNWNKRNWNGRNWNRSMPERKGKRLVVVRFL